MLGADAAGRLGHHRRLAGDPRVWLGGEWFAVIGILEPAPLAPDLDSAALIGYPSPTSCSRPRPVAVDAVRAHDARPVEAVRAVLARSVDPESPDEVEVSRPSDALEARARPTRRCATCCSGSARSPSSSAASASPT